MQLPSIAGKLVIAFGLSSAYGATKAVTHVANARFSEETQPPLREGEDSLRRWLDFQQIDRIPYSDSFQIANFRHNATDNYTETRNLPPLDILLVVDNSATMASYQQGLQNRLAELLSAVQSADWRIHIVTTDSTCPARGTINKGDPDFEQNFRNAVNAGVSGNYNEQGIRMARQAIESPCQGANWVRPNSALAILILSDEDNCSDHTGCQGSPWNDWQYLTDYLATIRSVGTTARVYGLIEDGNGAPNECRIAPSQPYDTQYYHAIFNTGGICGSIEDADYSTTLKRISLDLAQLMPTASVPLTHSPLNGAVTVKVNGNVLPTSGYRVQGQTVYLNAPMQTGQSLEASYVYEDPYTKDFTLSNFAAPDSVMVKVASTPIASTGFTYDTNTKVIALNIAVQPNDTVEVTYRENIPLISKFLVNRPIPNATTLECFLADGTPLHNFTFDPVAQAIVFSVPPTELQLFKCSYEL